MVSNNFKKLGSKLLETFLNDVAEIEVVNCNSIACALIIQKI